MYLTIENVYRYNKVQCLEKEDLKAILEKIKGVNSYWFILHDKDSNLETGELKQEHYHIIVQYNQPSTKTSASNQLTKYLEQIGLLKTCPNIRVDKIQNLKKYMRYLTHKDNREKYQYQDNEVITNTPDQYQEIIDIDIKELSTDKKILMFFKDIIKSSELINDQASGYLLIPYKELFNIAIKYDLVSYLLLHEAKLENALRKLYNVIIGD